MFDIIIVLRITIKKKNYKSKLNIEFLKSMARDVKQGR